jgi:hypothetical protein
MASTHKLTGHWVPSAGYVQYLNMHAGLHGKLVQTLDMYERAAASGGVPEGFTPEAVLVGR